MKKVIIGFIGTAFIAVIVAACNKAVDTAATTASGTEVSNVLSVCDQFAYPDSIFYQRSTLTYIVKPLKALVGTYGCFPAGLAIDPISGNIDIKNSETGLEYIVWFIPAGTTDTCKKIITVSGVNYTDSIYVMSTNAARALPIYNANRSTPIDCSGGCEFDDGPDDDNGNGTADEPTSTLASKGFVIDKTTGVINFKKSIQNGVLGLNPVSGTAKEFTLYYRLSDKSKKALNHISFKLFFYKYKSQIPADLKEDLSIKQSQVLFENEEGLDDKSGSNSGSNAIAVSLTNDVSSSKGSGETKCRPPYLVVTQF